MFCSKSFRIWRMRTADYRTTSEVAHASGELFRKRTVCSRSASRDSGPATADGWTGGQVAISSLFSSIRKRPVRESYGRLVRKIERGLAQRYLIGSLIRVGCAALIGQITQGDAGYGSRGIVGKPNRAKTDTYGISAVSLPLA